MQVDIYLLFSCAGMKVHKEYNFPNQILVTLTKLDGQVDTMTEATVKKMLLEECMCTMLFICVPQMIMSDQSYLNAYGPNPLLPLIPNSAIHFPTNLSPYHIHPSFPPTSPHPSLLPFTPPIPSSHLSPLPHPHILFSNFASPLQ